MAALDFPASPTNGQVYANWIYSTAKGAWQAKPITGKVTTSAVAPSAPTNGDEWFNTNDGNLYVYYTDVDGSQWVQVKSDATLSSTLGNRVTDLETIKIGMVPIVPSSVSVASGSATVSTTGLITVSGATNLIVNDCFSAAYKSYKMILTLTASGTTTIQTRLRNSSGLSSTNYTFRYIAVSAGTFGTAGTTSFEHTAYTTQDTASAEFLNPFLASTTQCTNFAIEVNTSYIGMGMNTNATSYNSLDFFKGNGEAFSATIQFYGLR